ncbi:TPA: APC family permease [Klebsiella variicola subsp. variicola]|uniref:APC family permease n=1 Tax=Klebsiella sp. JB_Kp010 TaxID=3153363 RepID=UPI0032B58952|nr:APC family permease [Klebsiella variicola subsp. variicola]
MSQEINHGILNNATVQRSEKSAETNILERNSVGVMSIVFFVIAAAAPLTVVVALFPVIIGSGNGIGIAGAFVSIALILLLFSVGYIAMSRHITNTGAFYSYITQGIGRPFGLGAASLTIFSYNAIQLGLYGGVGYYLDELMIHSFDVHLPWYVYSFASMAACLWLGMRRLHAGAMVLATLLTLETLIIVILDAGILLSPSTPALSSYTFEPFSLQATFSGSVGVAMMFAHASFIGFEGTAIYGEEAKNPKKTIPIATYTAVIFMGAFYSLTAWLLINVMGDKAVAITQVESGNLIFTVSRNVLGGLAAHAFEILIITSLFAAIVTFHNNVSRYLFAIGRQGLFCKAMGKTHPVRRSPYIACYIQTASVFVVVALFALLGLKPYDTLFTWFTGVGAAGIIMTQCLASIAIFVFFRRYNLDGRRWNTFIAPLLSIIGLCPILYIALTSFDVLLGVKGTLEYIFKGMLFGSFLIGFIWAWIIKLRSPDVYAGMASSLGDRI